MTNPVIENIRRSLGRTSQTPLAPRPDIHTSRADGSIESEIDHFLEEIKKLSGTGLRLGTGEVADALKTLLTEHHVRTATLWDTPRLKELKIADHLQALGVELVPANADKYRMAECDLGVTEVDFLLPETGTIALRSSAQKPRAASLLPRIHLAVASQSALRPDMHQVFAEAKNDPYLVLITGPSRTADIELTTTLGVHGPKTLYVWVMAEFAASRTFIG